jgi:hypothetical protein
VVSALALTGCNLGYVSGIYNQTSCPIQVQAAYLGSSIKNNVSIIVPGGKEVGIVPHREDRYEYIYVTDHDNIEHRYDSARLATLRLPKDSEEIWGYTDSGLVLLRAIPRQSDLDKLAMQPCSGRQKAPPAIS